MVALADDVGGQHGTLISPTMYREMVFPYQKRLISFVRERTHATVFYHTCGNVEALIDDLIDSGIDVLNPIQPLQSGMHPETLARRWGNRLVCHGGLDVQHILPYGDSAAEQAHVERYIMAPANTILPGTPPENISAAFAAAQNQ